MIRTMPSLGNDGAGHVTRILGWNVCCFAAVIAFDGFSFLAGSSVVMQRLRAHCPQGIYVCAPGIYVFFYCGAFRQ